MSSSVPNLPVDTSELDEKVGHIEALVESLHRALDGFAEGRTARLTGGQTRVVVHDALRNLDEDLRIVRELRAPPRKQVLGFVTQAMQAEALELRWMFQKFNKLWKPGFWKSNRRIVETFCRLSQIRIESLAEQIVVDESAPTSLAAKSYVRLAPGSSGPKAGV